MVSTSPLKNLTVVEIGHTMAAPYAGMILAELGANVIKVEAPERGDYTRDMPPFRDRSSSTYQALNRGKRGISVDLQDSAQLEMLRTLIVSRADIVLHNLKYGAMSRYGLGATELLEAKPSLIYCNIGAYGRKGPLRSYPGYDPLMQAYSGLMSIMGEDGRPPVRVGVSITDMATGLWAVVGIQAALVERAREGRGGVVDTSLLETALGWLTVPIASYLASGIAPKREGSGLAQMVPYQAFLTSDEHIMVAAGNNNLFRKLCGALGCHALADDSRFSTNSSRVENRQALISKLSPIFAQASSSEWLSKLQAAQVPCAPINTID